MTNKRAIIITLILLLGLGLVSGAKPRIVVLANSIDYEMAPDFFGFLKNKGMETIHATPSDFEQYKEEKFIVILGGPDAYEGVGEIVQEVLSEKEQNSIRKKGARKKYTKPDVWAKGQRITVIAGSDRTETKKSHEENRDDVAKEAEEEEVPETTVPPTTTPAPTTPPTTTPAPTTDAPPIGEWCISGYTYELDAGQGTTSTIIDGIETYKGGEFCKATYTSSLRGVDITTTYYFTYEGKEMWVITELMGQKTEIHIIDSQVVP